MIEKTCDYAVDCLHIIHLFKGNFNTNNKWIGKSTMHQAEQHNLLVEEQFGSHKDKTAITQCLCKEIQLTSKSLHYNPPEICVCFNSL